MLHPLAGRGKTPQMLLRADDINTVTWPGERMVTSIGPFLMPNSASNIAGRGARRIASFNREAIATTKRFVGHLASLHQTIRKFRKPGMRSPGSS